MTEKKYRVIVPDSDEEIETSSFSRSLSGYFPSGNDTDSSSQSRGALPKKDQKKTSLQACLLATSKHDILPVNRQDAITSPIKHEKGTSPLKCEKGTSPFKQEMGTSPIKIPAATEFQPTSRQKLTTEERDKVLRIFENVVGFSLKYPEFDNMYDHNSELRDIVANVMVRFGWDYKRARDSVIQSFRGYRRSHMDTN